MFSHLRGFCPRNTPGAPVPTCTGWEAGQAASHLPPKVPGLLGHSLAQSHTDLAGRPSMSTLIGCRTE